MEYVVLRTIILDHERLLSAGCAGRDLWTWGLLYAGRHETDGALPMAAVLASPWGAGGKKNVTVAGRLVTVGLWDRTDLGYMVCRWSEMGNKTRAQLDAARADARDRMTRRRSPSTVSPLLSGSPAPDRPPDVRANKQRTSVDVPTSTSDLRSDLKSREGIQGEVGVDAGRPGWFAAALEAVDVAAGVELGRDAGAWWMRYSGHRKNKGIAMTVEDAKYWLASVGVSEWREGRARQRARESRGGEVHAEPRPTAAQSEAFARALAQRVAGGGG